jgi:hypothetical protein
VSSLFDHLQRVLDWTIALGLWRPNPTTSTLRSQKTLSYDSLHPSNEDSFNLFFPLPSETLDGTTHRPHHLGVNFKYDDIKRELGVTFHFHCTPPFDQVVLAYVSGLSGPKEESSGSKDSTDNMSDLALDPLFLLPIILIRLLLLLQIFL